MRLIRSPRPARNTLPMQPSVSAAKQAERATGFSDLLKERVRFLLPRRIKKRRILSGPMSGMYICTSWHDYPAAILGRTEGRLLAMLGDLVAPGETWLDVSSHYGYTAIAIAQKVGPTGRVFAFEPVLETAGHLSATLRANRLNNTTVVPLGLTDSPVISKMFAPSNRGMTDHQQRTGEGPELPMLCVSLDATWDGLAGADQAVAGAKIDVQGMELAVLRGMEGVIRAWRPVLILEFHKGADRMAIAAILLANGYGSWTFGGGGTPGRLVTEWADDESYVFAPLSTDSR